MAAPILRHYDVRNWDEIPRNSDVASRTNSDDALTAFLNIQSMVLVVEGKKTEKRPHQKGDVVRDSEGNPILEATRPDGTQIFQTYKKDTVEYVEVTFDKPYCDPTKQGNADYLEKKLKAVFVLPDYDLLRAQYGMNTNYKRACELIEKMTKYYVVDYPQKFIERFAMFLSNAKAKALGYQPKWGILLSLVGNMGVGKSWFSEKIAETYDKTFGCKSAHATYEKILERFNSTMMTRGFIRLEEAAGLDKADMEKMKDYITGTDVCIERKGLDSETLPNLATFISTTNDPVMASLVGSDKNRRVVEFTITDKTGEIPEDDLEKWLMELWKVIPIRVPNEDDIKNELIAESSDALSSAMVDIVYDIFKNNPSIINGKHFVQHKFKSACIANKVQWQKVKKWCEDRGIINQTSDGHLNISHKQLQDLYATVEREQIGLPRAQNSDLDDIFTFKEG